VKSSTKKSLALIVLLSGTLFAQSGPERREGTFPCFGTPSKAGSSSN